MSALVCVPGANAYNVDPPGKSERDVARPSAVRLLARANGRPAAEQSEHAGRYLHTHIGVTDRRGEHQPWSMRPSLMRFSDTNGFHPVSGRRILNTAVNNDHVAWIEETARPGHGPTISVWTRRLLPRRGTPRLVARRAPGLHPLAASDIPWVGDVALLRDGSIAWVVQGRGEGVVLKQPGLLPRVVSPGYATIARLGADDGRTLWWITNGRVVLRDVLPMPMGDGCPVRSRFKRIFSRNGIVGSEAQFLDQVGATTELDVMSERMCRAGDGTDLRVPGDMTVQGAEAGKALLLGYSENEESCESHAAMYDFSQRRILRIARANDDCDAFSGQPDAVFTASGAVAWQLPDRVAEAEGQNFQHMLFVIRVGRPPRIVTIDSGHTITDLKASGEVFTWLSDGVPRTGR